MGMLRTQFPDLYLEDALPFLEKVIEEEYEQYPSVAEKILNTQDMPYGIAQHTQQSALSPLVETGEGSEIPQDKVYPGYSTTFKSAKFAAMISVSQEMLDHEKVQSLVKLPRKLSRSAHTTVETKTASVFNNAFSTTLSDGKVLCATDHPLLAPGAGTGSNALATPADLSITSLKDMITVFHKQVDTAGNKLMISPKWLLVPQELSFLAHELVKSAFLPEGSYNNVNSVNTLYSIEPIVWQYLTDADAFFLCGDKMDHELHMFWDKRFEVKSAMDFKTDSALTRGLLRFAYGASDWRGVVGTPGAP